jgi:polysaccharide biosynthesis protein VpsJ
MAHAMLQNVSARIHGESAAPTSCFDDVYRRLVAKLEAVDFCGADPFDALNSSVFERLPLSSLPMARLAWLQLFKKSPYDFRAVAKVPPSTNPVTLALAARTYALTDEDEKQHHAVERLIRLRSDPEHWGHGAWGYPFPWQAKAFYVARGVPNVIATAYAVRAVADCYPTSAESKRIVSDAAAFVGSKLVCRSADGAPYIGYVPRSDTMVHNANLWGAYVLALAAHRGDHRWRALADAAIDYTLRAQTPEGAWAYGESSHHRWIDGFHTGYVLEALQLCRGLLQRHDLTESIARGTQYYLRSFLRDDGVVPYYADGSGPLDVNNFAQMVVTLECVRPTPDWIALADRTLAVAIRELWRPDADAFAYQRRGWRINRICYPRWTQIWMMYALGLRLAQRDASAARQPSA